VAKWRQSGLSAERFAQGREFSGSALRIAERRLKSAEDSRSSGDSGRSRSSVPRVARVVRFSPPAAQEAVLTLELPAGRVLVPSGCDESTLRLALTALHGLGGRP
jgi:hypothetical protein